MPSSALRARVRALPDTPGVYQWKSLSGEILYVGKAKSLRRRVASYMRPVQAHPRTASLVQLIADLEWIVTPSEADALALEETLIRRHRPRFNVALVDDGGYPYLRITLEEPFPRVLVTRDASEPGSRYIGPFTDPVRLKALRGAIARAFHVRSCSYDLPRTRPARACLDFHIGKCLAPCVFRQSKEDYRSMINDIISVAEGDTAVLLERLASDMERSSAAMNFELAARLRDQIKALSAPAPSPSTVLAARIDRDVVAISRSSATACVVWLKVRAGRVVDRKLRFVPLTVEADDTEILHAWLRDEWRHDPDRVRDLVVPSRDMAPSGYPDVRVTFPARGPLRSLVAMARENASAMLSELPPTTMALPALDDLREALSLVEAPKTIVCFDVSHSSGAHTVASMVAFRNGVPEKSLYRSYNIRTVSWIDDPASIYEAVSRFAARAAAVSDAPDLVVIDGGPTQLSRARQALVEQGLPDLPVISLAKRLEEVYLPSQKEPLALDPSSPAVLLLRAIRDEAHRFALTRSRGQRRKAMVSGALDKVKGLGPQKRALLLRQFGSVAGIRRASVEEIAHLPGFTITSAERLLEAIAEPVGAR